MLRPGIDSIQVTATQAVASPRKVSIYVMDNLVPSRAQALNGSLDLEVRWGNWASERLAREISAFVAKSAQQRNSNHAMTVEELADVIVTEIKWINRRLGVDPNGLRLKAVLEYQREAQLPEILAELLAFKVCADH